MAMDTRPQWWEKTVEYAFVLQFIKDADNAFPLAGDPETAFGDLLLQAGATFRLIEFKARAANIQDEKRKWGFGDPDTSGKRWQAWPGSFQEMLACHCPVIVAAAGHAAHWLVYGRPHASGFDLAAQGYSQASEVWPLAGPGSFDALASVCCEDMVAYLSLLEAVRGDAGVSGQGLVLAGVAGGKSIVLTTAEFRRHADPHYVPAHRDTHAAAPVSKPAAASNKPRI